MEPEQKIIASTLSLISSLLLLHVDSSLWAHQFWGWTECHVTNPLQVFILAFLGTFTWKSNTGRCAEGVYKKGSEKDISFIRPTSLSVRTLVPQSTQWPLRSPATHIPCIKSFWSPLKHHRDAFAGLPPTSGPSLVWGSQLPSWPCTFSLLFPCPVDMDEITQLLHLFLWEPSQQSLGSMLEGAGSLSRPWMAFLNPDPDSGQNSNS